MGFILHLLRSGVNVHLAEQQQDQEFEIDLLERGGDPRRLPVQQHRQPGARLAGIEAVAIPAVEIEKGGPLLRGGHVQQFGDLVRPEFTGHQEEILGREQRQQFLAIGGIEQQVQFLAGTGKAEDVKLVGPWQERRILWRSAISRGESTSAHLLGGRAM